MITIKKFHASWCQPCKQLSEMMKDIENVESIDIDTNPELFKEYGVRNAPTTIAINFNVK